MSQEENFPNNDLSPNNLPVKKGIINPWTAIIFRGVTTGALIGLFCHYGIVRRAPKTYIDRVMYIGNMVIGATAGVGVGIDSFKYDLGFISSYFRKGVDMSYIENVANPKDPFVSMLIPEKIEDYQLFRKDSSSLFNFNFFNFKDDSYEIRARILKENLEKERKQLSNPFNSDDNNQDNLASQNSLWGTKPSESWEETKENDKNDKKPYW